MTAVTVGQGRPYREADGGYGSLAVLKERVDHELGVFARTETALLEAVDPELKPVAEQLRAAIAVGKRLRAAFCYWGWLAAGREDSDDMVRAAASMELVHAAAVVHDDVIDQSGLRHGRPTAHRALIPRGRRGGEDAESTGRALAILLGDLLISWAGQLFSGCGLPGAYLNRARPLWARLARELVAGECLEVLRTGASGRDPVGADSSLKIIRYKTAKYTVEHPLHIGALLGGAPPALLEVFSAYGVPLGEAFQLRDDLLGVFGAPDVTGKSNLDDIAGARPTVLLALARQRAGAAERCELRALLECPEPGREQLDRFREIAERTGARRRVEELIAVRGDAAAAAVEAGLLGGLLSADAADALHALARTALARAL
ncbi:polyprenyl synthetase [Streptomyces inusitatus]|uniref:Polyprenyl synthetase n=1 Tax=Streptomyces inusitatus TaxID=68221 RepID=A0A918V2K2_9ACTN|nr:polyprenyl synthetase family protein [Streptomyces inusitatus]GGZ59728.1 polyprenyl synthetase [Streptomyces inusitatus]